MDKRADRSKKRKKILSQLPTSRILVTNHNNLLVRDVREEGVIKGVEMMHNSHLMYLTNNYYHQKELPVKQASLIISPQGLLPPLASERRNLIDKNAVIALLTALNLFKNKIVGGARGGKRPK